jgi:anti-anti-sigma factor
MKITESRSSRGITLFVAGSVNSTTSPQLQNEIFRASKINANVLLDFSDVISIDNFGTRVLHAGSRAVASRRGRLQVQNANAAVKNELQVDGLGRMLLS